MMNQFTKLIFATTLACSSQVASALIINFDYTYDSSGFFNANRSNILESAGSKFTSRIADNLSAINSDSATQYDTVFSTPDGTGTTNNTNTSIAENSITIYVGAQAFSGGTLAQAGPGGYGYSTSDPLFDPNRGQGTTTGPSATDFSLWGGSMSFNSSSNWYFDTDTSTTESFSGNDFYSVALHELGHVFGIGIADSWNNQISGSNFTGLNSSALYGSNVGLDNGAHWANGTSYNGQEASMTASITTGTRKEFTELDYAALSDVGWEITPVPVPPAVFLFASGLLGLVGFSRRKLK